MLPPVLWISAWETLSSSLAALWFLSLGWSSQSPWGHHRQCPLQPRPHLQLGWPLPAAPRAHLLPRSHWRPAATAVGEDRTMCRYLEAPEGAKSSQMLIWQKSCQSGQSIDKMVTTKCFHYWKVSGFFFFLSYFYSKDIFLNIFGS